MLILWAILIMSPWQNIIDPADIWKYFLIGLGSIFIIQSVFNYFSSMPRTFTFSRLIPGLVLLFVGLGFVLNFSAAWPVALCVAPASASFSFPGSHSGKLEKRKTTQEIYMKARLIPPYYRQCQ